MTGPDTDTPVCLVAFAGEAAELAASLAQCRHLAGRELLVLASPDESLERQASEAGCGFLPELPDSCPDQRYWVTVGAVLASRPGPWLVVRAGTRLPLHWERRLAAPDPLCMALFPLSVRHPCTGVFATTELEPGLDVHQVDRWLNAYLSGRSNGRSWDIPLFAGQSAWVHASQLPLEGCRDDQGLARALRHEGGLLLATDNLYVDDRHLTPVTLPEGLYPAWEQALLRRHPLSGVRHALGELSERRESPPASVPAVKPATLHVSHSWGGGLGRWIEDFTNADHGSVSYILRPIGDWSGFGQTLALYAADNPGFPLRTWTLAEPILSTALAHREYRELLDSVLEDFHIEAIAVSSLIGHSLDALRTSRPTLLVVHDFYPFCPPILATWDNPCTRCDASRLRECLRDNPGHRFFLVEDAEHWLALRRAYFEELARETLQIVVPSQSVAERLRSLMPVLRDRAIQVIPHGMPESLLDSLHPVSPEPRAGRPLRVVVLGSLEQHKGSGLLSAALERLIPVVELFLVGCGEGGRSFAGQPGVRLVESYPREELGRVLAELRPDLGLLLSVVPETFSYTLSELRAAAIPVVATRLGAFTDRISDGETGWLIHPTGQALADQVLQLAAQPQLLDAVHKRLLALPRRTAELMVADYRALLPASRGLLRRPLHSGGHALVASSTIRINPEAGFAQVFREFRAYTCRKIEATERLPRWLKRLLLPLARPRL